MPLFKLPIIICLIVAAFCVPVFTTESAENERGTFVIGEKDFLLNGEPFNIYCGEIHYARVPRAYWKHRLEMVRATGMNTVCVYLFWNFHERKEGVFTWEGQADVAEFCRLAQEAGLWVILRPGPYSCAEWEMGGLPWWLLKHEDIALRSRDPRFVKAAHKYFKEVGRVLGDLQISKGGPILMVQVENEYGFYGEDVEYMKTMRKGLTDTGFEVPLFGCNPPYYLNRGRDEEVFQVVNFGSNPASAFAALRKIQPKGPLMCGEFYPAWFDTWGNPHRYSDADKYVATLDEMMKMGASYSIYMVHGGTSFGFWSGADRPFKPDTSSYDYDAPVSEAGWTTPSFFKLREMVASHLPDGVEIPAPPKQNPVIEIPSTPMKDFASLQDNLPEAIYLDHPANFEKLDVWRGGMLYRTVLSPGPEGTVNAEAINDFSWVFLDGKLIGTTDRRSRGFKVNVPSRNKETVLEFFVWSMGRINFGPEMHDRKGVHGPVVFSSNGDSNELLGWKHYPMTMELPYLNDLEFSSSGVPNRSSAYPAFWKGCFELKETGDTFLDMRTWGKGAVWVNGKALGRFWNIGPTQTMYVPGPWLKEGTNEIIVFDLLGPTDPHVAGFKKPILDELRPELDFAGPRRPLRYLNLGDTRPVEKGSLANDGNMKTVWFKQPVTGRYVAFRSTSSHDKSDVATIGELDFFNADKEMISHEKWTIAYVSSEERYEMDGTAENAIDGQTSSIWSTYYSHNTPSHPHVIVVDLGESTSLSGMRYVPGQSGNAMGIVKGFELFVGDTLVQSNKDNEK
jgi:beta-galactosidase